MLESYVKATLRKKDILLMTHIVLGYPSFEDSFAVVETMVHAGIDMVELQIPFSDPIADGPVILRANQKALHAGVTVQGCLDFAADLAGAFPIPFLIMTYYNIVYMYGEDRFISAMKQCNLQGAIIPDLPPEEGRRFLRKVAVKGMAPILIFSPTTSFERKKSLGALGQGFIYCVARKGVTGEGTIFSGELTHYLSECRRATPLPLALGFGVKEKSQVDFLKGKADIAIIGTQTIRVLEQDGIAAVGDFLRGL